MKPEWRRLLPLPAAFLVGVLGSLLLAPGPRSTNAGDGGQESWALPAGQAQDLAVADAIWDERHPWGRPPVTAAEAAALAVPVAVPVGVVEDRGGLQALFSFDGALPVPVDVGGTTPDGGTVTAIAPTVITWRDAAGRARRHELFLEESAAGTSPVHGTNGLQAPPVAGPRSGQQQPRPEQRPSSNSSRQPRPRQDSTSRTH